MANLKTYVFLIILIIGLFWAGYRAGSTWEPSDSDSVSLSSSSREGSYALVNGTKGCPRTVDWADHCGGFILNTVEVDSTFNVERFCHMNAGPKIAQAFKAYGKERVQTSVSQADNVIQKRTFTTMIAKGLSNTIPQEDTLIFGDVGKFLWEHSRAGKGHSCLYSKTSI